MGRTSRVRLILLATMMMSMTGVFTAEMAWASCSGSQVHDAVGGYEGSGTARYGDKASVLVNDFASNQYWSWRSVAIVKSSSTFAEAGWQLQEAIGNQGAHPYKTWKTDGCAWQLHGYERLPHEGVDARIQDARSER